MRLYLFIEIISSGGKLAHCTKLYIDKSIVLSTNINSHKCVPRKEINKNSRKCGLNKYTEYQSYAV